MKKGFTLIELLIVMVIVGTLVTIALPKYQNALERGRALEGLRNVQYGAEYVNAKHMATGSWPTYDELVESLNRTDITRKTFFEVPSFDAAKQAMSSKRSSGDWDYGFKATIVDDALSSIVCIGNDCASLDLGSGTGTEPGDNLMTRK